MIQILEKLVRDLDFNWLAFRFWFFEWSFMVPPFGFDCLKTGIGELSVQFVPIFENGGSDSNFFFVIFEFWILIGFEYQKFEFPNLNDFFFWYWNWSWQFPSNSEKDQPILGFSFGFWTVEKRNGGRRSRSEQSPSVTRSRNSRPNPPRFNPLHCTPIRFSRLQPAPIRLNPLHPPSIWSTDETWPVLNCLNLL